MANLLHVDRDKATQNLVHSTLGKQFNIITANDSPTAMQYSAMIKPDVILVNLADPTLDGEQLVARLRMFMPHAMILTLTTPEQVSVKLHESIDDVILHPATPAALLEKIQQQIAPQTDQADVAATLSDRAVQAANAQIAALTEATNRLASLNSIGALIGTSLDLEHLTDEVLSQLDDSISFDSATLFLLKGDTLEAAASRGLLGFGGGMNSYTRSDKNSAWQVVNNKIPLIIQDVTTSPYWEQRPELSNVRSWLGVPLLYKDRVVGALTLDSNQVNSFSEEDSRYLFTLASQIAISVENAQLFQSWEEQATRLKLINEAAQEMNASLNDQGLYRVLGRVLHRRLTYDYVALYNVAADGKISLRQSFGINHQSCSLEALSDVAKQGSQLLLNGNHQTMPPATDGISRLINPIFDSSRVVGLIEVRVYRSNGFSDYDLWTISSLASQATAVLNNIRLYQEIQNYSTKLERVVLARTERLQAIKQMGLVVSQDLNIDELLSQASQGMCQIFADRRNAEIDLVIALTQGNHLILNTFNHVVEDEREADAPLTMTRTTRVQALDAASVIGETIATGKPLLVGNGAAPVQEEGMLRDSLMLAPLIAGGKTLGAVTVARKGADVFDESDLETLEAVAFQVASSIEHVRLLRTARDVAVAEERTRLASDMHDGVAQNLASLMLQVDRCLNKVENGSDLEAQLEGISDLLARNIEELRRNIFDLRPIDLEGKSLLHTLERFVTEFGQRWGIKTKYTVDDQARLFLPQLRLSSEVEQSLYRILQEGLANARQHASASHLTVHLAVEASQAVLLTIEDDGRGFDVNAEIARDGKRPNRGLGLMSIRDRAERVGGTLQIDSQQGQGTRVTARLPLYIN